MNHRRPFLKWAGSKSKLIPWIARAIPQTARRLIEPFAGSAALSLALDFEAYVLNDINRDLIHLYQTLKIEKTAFIDYARSFFTAEHNQENRFYDLRAQFNGSDDIFERSALFLYLNRHGFNGLCRYNRAGQFNVPFGRYRAPYFPEAEMRHFIEKSERFTLLCGDFQTAFHQANRDDIIYCDPPYVPLSATASFTAYAQKGFTLNEQRQLAQMAQQTAPRVKSILISNHDTDFTRALYHGARLNCFSVRRSIAARGNCRKKVKELLAIYNENAAF